MQIVNDSKAVLTVKINPWLKEIDIIHIATREAYTYVYEEVDEWFSYHFGDEVYDFHILYDDGLDFSVYPVINGEVDYTTIVPHNLHLIY